MPENDTDLVSAPKARCPKCGGEIDKGTLSAGGNQLSYLSENSPKSFLHYKYVAVQAAKACYRCGYVELYLDPAALTRSIAKP